MRALTASLVREEAAIANHESVADQQKDDLHSALTNSVLSIVAAVAAGEDDPMCSSAPLGHISAATGEEAAREAATSARNVMESNVQSGLGGTADEVVMSAERSAPASKSNTANLPASHVGLGRKSGGGATQPRRFKLPEPDTASLTSEISRLASKPLLADAPPPRRSHAH